MTNKAIRIGSGAYEDEDGKEHVFACYQPAPGVSVREAIVSLGLVEVPWRDKGRAEDAGAVVASVGEPGEAPAYAAKSWAANDG